MLEKIKKHKKLMIAIVVIVIIAIVIGILVHRMRQSASEITPGGQWHTGIYPAKAGHVKFRKYQWNGGE